MVEGCGKCTTTGKIAVNKRQPSGSQLASLNTKLAPESEPRLATEYLELYPMPVGCAKGWPWRGPGGGKRKLIIAGCDREMMAEEEQGSLEDRRFHAPDVMAAPSCDESRQHSLRRDDAGGY
jgi:hypothetical protein